MKAIDVFVDTCTVNRLLGLDVAKVDDFKYEEDREYLTRILRQYVERGSIRLIVNPAIRQEIEDTEDERKMEALLELYSQFHFTPFNKSVFPWFFPVTFLKEDEKKNLNVILEEFPSFKQDEKIFADVVFNPEIGIILTTDRKHFRKTKLTYFLERSGLNEKIRIFTPKELFQYLQKVA